MYICISVQTSEIMVLASLDTLHKNVPVCSAAISKKIESLLGRTLPGIEVDFQFRSLVVANPVMMT